MANEISNRKLLTFILLTFGNFFAGASISVLAPFYPAEAEKKGSSATEYGMVFSVFECIAFVLSPLIGKYLYKLGPRLVLNLGLLGYSVGCILFGVLDNIDDHDWFITLSFTFRIIEALGNAAYVTASFAVIAMEFPESMAKTFAALETAFGAGLIAGPPIGGVLFQLGGFRLPFLVIGGFFICAAVLSPFLTPRSTNSVIDNSFSTEKITVTNPGILKLLTTPGAFIAALNVLSCGISNGFMCTILEPHIRQFDLTPVQVTGVFVLLMGTYAVSAPAWGWVCDKLSQTIFVSLAGSIIMVIGCLIIGPAPFLPLNTILWVTCIGCGLQGLGTGALNVSSYLQLTEWSKKMGYPDDITTYGLNSGIWFSMMSLGSFIGPLAAGMLFDYVGFRMGSLLCIVEHFVMIILQTAFIVWIYVRQNSYGGFVNRRRSSTSSESEHLLLCA